MQTLDVSVVVPTRNRRGLVLETLHTIRGQRDVDLEVIVIDDGSTDGTGEAVSGFGDPRIRVVRHETSLGVSAARNRGIAESRGEWVGFCDDDDLWAPDKLASQIQAARTAGAEWAYCGSVFVNAQRRISGGEPPLDPDALVPLLYRWDPVPGGCSNVIVSRAALLQVGPFAPEFGTLADWELWLRLAARGAPAWVPRPLMAYRVHEANMSLDVGRTLAELDLLEHRIGIAVDRTRFDRYLASQCLRSGRKAEALRLLARAALVDRAGYGVAEGRADLSLLWRFAIDGARRRVGLDGSGRLRRRDKRQRRRDPNLKWKVEAQGWLDCLSGFPARSTSASTQP